MGDQTPPPLLGFNNNVKHRGRIFHIQTEDSGVKHPHVITHLFADGGRIIKSTKTNYSEHVGRADMAQVVRKLMKEQHKAMFIALRGGDFDDHIAEMVGPFVEPPKAVTRASVAAMGAVSPSKIGMPAADPASAQLRASAKVEPASETVRTAAKVEPGSETMPKAQEVAAAPEAKPAAEEKPASKPAPSSSPPVSRPARSRKISNPNLRPVTPFATPGQGGEIDFDSIERAAREAAQQNERTAAQASPVPDAPRRYEGSRPASIFEQEESPAPPSIFGDGVISEKSLDEVILSYLAEDLETKASGK